MGSVSYTWSIPGGASLSLMDKMVVEKEIGYMISGLVSNEEERLRKMMGQMKQSVKNLESSLQNKIHNIQSMDSRGIDSGSVRCSYNNLLNTYKWNVDRLNAVAAEMKSGKTFSSIVNSKAIKRPVEVVITIR